MRVCLTCGKKNLAGFAFCQKCGAELAEPPSANSAFSQPFADADGGPQLDSDDVEEPLIVLLEQGKKLEAIKLYRARTGAGLAEAKAAVEQLQRQEAIETGDLEPQLVDLLKRGEKIAAIKLYRGHTGAGLAESKTAVEHVAAKHGLATGRSGCLGVVLATAMVVLWTLISLHAFPTLTSGL